MLCMKAPSRQSQVRETVKLPEEGHREGVGARQEGEAQGNAGSEQPSRIEDLEHERVRKQQKHDTYLEMNRLESMDYVEQANQIRYTYGYMSITTNNQFYTYNIIRINLYIACNVSYGDILSFCICQIFKYLV
ncbi:Hypothetical_protein [Hexamita inflata]|uniref:Hypothetical_protein n=1 Tax=Hexamita inflata TaxID=28002 RepID=A0AA86PQN3_9EUKA|nr:Hypothetical protein HINF_LOCUS27007 [Hexamita inflata]